MRWSQLIPKRHWSPSYLVRRTRLAMWQRRHPDAPWLPPSAVAFLENWLRPTDRVVEFGSGRSTAWFARRVAEVTSVEHDGRWHRQVLEMLERQQLGNADVIATSNDSAEAYLEPLRARWSGSAELILVDGRHRDSCAMWALDNIAAGGLVVVDNAERYVASPSRSPEALRAKVPASDLWVTFSKRIARNRQIWFDSGVTATLAILC